MSIGINQPEHPIIHIRQFWCESCQMEDPMDAEALGEHLKSVHGLDARPRGKRTGRLFMDLVGGEYSNTYDWILPGKVRLTELSEGRRKS